MWALLDKLRNGCRLIIMWMIWEKLFTSLGHVSDVFCVFEHLVTILSNYYEEYILHYDKLAVALSSWCSHSKIPLKLDIDLKNWETPLDKPSAEEPLNLKMREIPSPLQYVFLGVKKNNFPLS